MSNAAQCLQMAYDATVKTRGPRGQFAPRPRRSAVIHELLRQEVTLRLAEPPSDGSTGRGDTGGDDSSQFTSLPPLSVSTDRMPPVDPPCPSYRADAFLISVFLAASALLIPAPLAADYLGLLALAALVCAWEGR